MLRTYESHIGDLVGIKNTTDGFYVYHETFFCGHGALCDKIEKIIRVSEKLQRNSYIYVLLHFLMSRVSGIKSVRKYINLTVQHEKNDSTDFIGVI